MESEGAWTELAKAVPGDLLRVAVAKAALALLDGAVAELDQRVEWTRRLALGPLARGDFPHKPFDSTARDLLQAARREVHAMASDHAAVGRAFAVARARIGASKHADLVEAYEARRLDALLFGKDCLTRLLSAAGHAEAAAEAFELARGVAYASPIWRGWADAAEGLARAALQEASAAIDALVGMQREVASEFFAGWQVIKAVERDASKKTARAVPVKLYMVATFVLRALSDEPSSVSPTDKVRAAHADLVRVLKFHAGAGQELTNSATQLDLPRSDLWKRWRTRHEEVANAGNEAVVSLAAAANMMYCFDVNLHDGKPTEGFILGARNLLRSAHDGLVRMRTAATLEFFSSCWFVLKSIQD